MELISLTRELEQLWGVEAKPGVVEAVFIPTHEVVKEAQTEFEVVLLSFPADKKIALVKVIREVLGLGLLESKNVIESVLPKSIKDGMSQVDAEALKVRLMETGAVAEIR
jgi:large subunit ribosomal protein L7/L12